MVVPLIPSKTGWAQLKMWGEAPKFFFGAWRRNNYYHHFAPPLLKSFWRLWRRRQCGDLIETFKILTGREDVNYSKFFKLADVTSGLRGHSLKLFKPRCHTTVRQNFFSLQIVNEWNKLPQDVVEALSINTFKNRLDRHWHDMGIQSWQLHSPSTSSNK